MSKTFDTINIHTLMRKLLLIRFLDRLIEFMANYKAYTTYINHTSWHSTQSTGSGHGLRRWHYHHIYIDTHECSQDLHTTIPTYSFAWTNHNHLTLNPDKTTCTLFTPDPAEYKRNLDVNNTALPMTIHPKVMGLTLDPKLIYSTQIHNISVQRHTPLQMIKAATATG